MNGVHDMGGMHGFGPVVRDEAVFHAEWEKRVAAIAGLARTVGLRNIDESRHGIERMAPADYLRAGYYERWLASLEITLADKGVIAPEELEARAARFEADPSAPPPRREDPALRQRVNAIGGRGFMPLSDGPSPRFAPGDAVVTRNAHPRGHTRLPRYARGKRGVVDRYHGVHPLPDTNAHGLGEQPQPLYCVRFEARELWGDEADGRGCVYIDLWESYLEEAT